MVTYIGGGINRLKYHLTHIPRCDIKICKEVPQDVIRDMQALLEEKKEKKEFLKKQQEEMAQLARTRNVEGSSSYHGHGHPRVPPSSTIAS